jgi:hypothetical protein
MRNWFSAMWAGLVRATAGPFNLLRGLFPVRWSDPPVLGTKDLLEGYDSMPWLRAVAGKVGDAVGLTHWRLFSIRQNGKALRHRAAFLPWAERERALASMRSAWVRAQSPVGKATGLTTDTSECREEEHVFLGVLAEPNPFMGHFGLMKLTEVHLDVVGEAYWVVERNSLGVPCGLWPIPPHWVTEKPLPDRPAYTVQYQAWQATLPERDVVPFLEPAPVHPYTRGSGIGWTLGDELEVDEYAAKMARALFFNQARPDFVVYGFDSPEEKKRLERSWLDRLQGFQRQNRPFFLTGEPKFHEFSRPTMEQLVYPGLRKAQRDIVLQTWGAPPELFGIIENSNRATIEAAEYLFARWVILPRAERLRGVIQRFVHREFDDRLILHFDSPVAADKQHELAVARVAGRKVDEWRAMQGLPPLGGPEGEAYQIPAGTQLVDDLVAALNSGPASRRPS